MSGQVQYITYVRDTGELNQVIPRTEVVFQNPLSANPIKR
jgi:hypothetical protein